jgi:hypothetical protein
MGIFNSHSSGSSKNVISINGVTIETNKNSLSANGSMVRFNDGSWYNIATAEFHDGGGNGYVKVNGCVMQGSGPSSDESDEIVVKHGAFSDTLDLSLDISSVNITVDTHESKGISYEITGPKSMVDGITIRQAGTTAVFGESGSSVGSTIVSTGNVSIIGGVRFGGSRSTPNSVLLKILVPRGTAIEAETSGTGKITIGNVCGSLDAEASGQGCIHAEKVEGDVSLSISGTASIAVASGKISQLKVDISGVGNVHVGGTSQNAKLKVSGVGNIDVAHVVNQPIRKTSGVGRITVAQVG